MVITLGVRCRDGVEHAHLQRSSAVPQKMYQDIFLKKVYQAGKEADAVPFLIQ